jgi:hypothetical protein
MDELAYGRYRPKTDPWLTVSGWLWLAYTGGVAFAALWLLA